MRISDWSSDVCSSDLLTERNDQPRILGDRDEFGRRHRLAFAIVPARERLESRDLARRQFDQRLESEVQPVLFDRAAQRGLQPEAVVGEDRRRIGRASCRERVCQYVYISVVAVSLKKKITHIIICATS